MKYIFLVINPNVFLWWRNICVTATVFSTKYKKHIHFFHFDLSETFGPEKLTQTVMTGGECVLQELWFITESLQNKYVSFSSGTYSLFLTVYYCTSSNKQVFLI